MKNLEGKDRTWDTTRFHFQDHRNTKVSLGDMVKLRRKKYTFLREFQEHMPYKQGIFIDIFLT